MHESCMGLKIAEIKADANAKDTADGKIAIAELENK